MSSDVNFVSYIVDQITGAGRISYRKMFGEYALYCDGKVVALVCDDQLFLKPTTAGRQAIPDLVETPPYPGGKDWFLIDAGLDDADWISELVRLTAAELPLPKPKKPKKPRGVA